MNGNQLDIVLVSNPDVNCDHVDPERGYSHQDYFEVRWDGQPYRIKPGETKRLPRFLATHFTKHLADHMLLMEEERTKRQQLMRNPVERARVEALIFQGVEEAFAPDEETDQAKLARLVGDINQPKAPDPIVNAFTSSNTGQVHDVDGGKELVLDIPPAPAQVQESGEPSMYDKYTRADLLKEAKTLGISITNTDTKADLIEKISKF